MLRSLYLSSCCCRTRTERTCPLPACTVINQSFGQHGSFGQSRFSGCPVQIPQIFWHRHIVSSYSRVYSTFCVCWEPVRWSIKLFVSKKSHFWSCIATTSAVGIILSLHPSMRLIGYFIIQFTACRPYIWRCASRSRKTVRRWYFAGAKGRLIPRYGQNLAQ